MNVLELLGAIGGNALSLPGILGLAFGLMTRNFWIGAIVGAIVGVFETLIFAHWQLAGIESLELTVAVVIGIVAGTMGTLIRRKGASV